MDAEKRSKHGVLKRWHAFLCDKSVASPEQLTRARDSGDVIVVDIGTRWDGVNCDGISQEYQMRAERKEGLAASLPGVVKTRELFCCCPACFAKDYDHCSFPTETSPFVLHVWSFGVRPPPKQRRPRAAGVAGVVLDLGVGAGAGGAAGIGAIPVVGGGGAAGMGAPPIIGGRGTGGERVDVLVDGGVEGGVGVRGAPAIVPQREAGVAPGGAGGGDPEFAVAAVDGEDEIKSATVTVCHWLQCSFRKCKKWRRLADGDIPSNHPGRFECKNNDWDDRFNDCDVDEEIYDMVEAPLDGDIED